MHPADLDELLRYLHALSDQSKNRFGPHAFDRDSVIHCLNDSSVKAYIAEDSSNQQIIAYALIKAGLLWHDEPRLMNYGYPDIARDCCTFAPSVADEWQSRGGIGKGLFHYIKTQLQSANIARVILWGGVQEQNEKAVHFYRKAGFIELGRFEYNGSNLDMLLEMSNAGQTLKRD